MDHGQIKLSDFGGKSRQRVDEIGALFTASGIRCQVLDDLRQTRWEKLVWNVPFNGLGAVMDRTTDQLIATPNGRALVMSLMNEVIATAGKLGILLPAEIAQQKIDATYSMGGYRTSMQIDRHEGRPLEVEAILHKPLLAAQSCGISTPYLTALYNMARVLPS
jgi:2-dehydropantoate 2-reductase